MLLTKGQILKVEKRKFRDLEVPELGGQIRIASISAGCGLSLKELGAKGDSQREMALVMFGSSIVDEHGAPMFDSDTASQFLNMISIETMNQIVGAITELSRGKPSANGAEVAGANPSVAAPSASSPSA
jgi:hypothetical protein